MNERIRELAEQAGIKVFTHIKTIATDKNDLEKFAELIVRDVCNKLEPVLSQEILEYYEVE